MTSKLNTETAPDTTGTKHGSYSPNGVMLFMLLLLTVLLPFSEASLIRYTYSIKHPALRNICHAVTEPVIAAADTLHISGISKTIRRVFLRTTGLETRAEWDVFFYTDTADEDFENDKDTVDPQTAAGTGSEPVQNTAAATSGEPVQNTASSQNTAAVSLAGGQKTKQAYHIEQIVIPYSSEHPVRLLLFGDSQMHYLAAGMRRALAENTAIQIEDISVHSSGFLRSDYYNWPKKLKTVLENRPNGTAFHAAVILLGMNDYQNAYTRSGGLLKAGSPAWEQVYRKQIRRHITAVLQHVPKIYRLGLPCVRSRNYGKKLAYLEKIQADITKEYRNAVTDIPFADATRELGMGYIEAVKTDDGTWTNFMQNDGIHFSIAGSEYIMKHLLTVIHEDFLFE